MELTGSLEAPASSYHHPPSTFPVSKLQAPVLNDLIKMINKWSQWPSKSCLTLVLFVFVVVVYFFSLFSTLRSAHVKPTTGNVHMLSTCDMIILYTMSSTCDMIILHTMSSTRDMITLFTMLSTCDMIILYTDCPRKSIPLTTISAVSCYD